jgi:hypothetical protein
MTSRRRSLNRPGAARDNAIPRQSNSKARNLDIKLSGSKYSEKVYLSQKRKEETHLEARSAVTAILVLKNILKGVWSGYE